MVPTSYPRHESRSPWSSFRPSRGGGSASCQPDNPDATPAKPPQRFMAEGAMPNVTEGRRIRANYSTLLRTGMAAALPTCDPGSALVNCQSKAVGRCRSNYASRRGDCNGQDEAPRPVGGQREAGRDNRGRAVDAGGPVLRV